MTFTPPFLVSFPSVMERAVQIGRAELKKDVSDSSITSGALGLCDPPLSHINDLVTFTCDAK